MMIKVSIIVPVYNVYDYLDKCLDSLVKQTLNDIEIIVIDDGSPDNSFEIIDRYCKKYPFVKAYKKDNGGLSDARNYGISKAHGEYISFVDSDDYIDKDMIKKMYNYGIDNNLDIIVCDSINVYKDNNEVYIKSNLKYSEEEVKNYLISPPMACCRMIKRDIISKLKFKKGIYYEDLELMPKLVKYTKKIGFLEEGLYYYLQRDGSIMKQKEFNSKLYDIFDILESNKKLLYDKYPLEIEYMYITHLLRSASLRFLEYDNYKENILKIIDIIKYDFPDFRKNIYYKKSSIKLKIICNLAYYKQYKLLKIIKKLTGK